MKLRVKMHSLATIRKPSEPMPGPVERKPEVIYPTLTLNSKQMAELGKLTRGDQCRLLINAEVTGVRGPEEWEKRSEGLDEDASIVSFKLLAGAHEPMDPMKGYKAKET